MDAREPYAIQIQFLAERFTSIVVNSRLKSCSISLSLLLSLKDLSICDSIGLYTSSETRNSPLSPVYPVLIRADSVAKRTREWIWQKTRHLGGLAAIQSYFLLASFSFLALPSRSSVHSAIYTAPALSCHIYIRSFRFV